MFFIVGDVCKHGHMPSNLPLTRSMWISMKKRKKLNHMYNVQKAKILQRSKEEAWTSAKLDEYLTSHNLKFDDFAPSSSNKLKERPYSLRKGMRLKVDTEPREISENLAHTIVQIIQHGDAMCGGNISPTYIRRLVSDLSNDCWLIRETDETIVGFALGSRRMRMRPSIISWYHLHLICSMRGEGLQLFENILVYFRKHSDSVQHLDLDAVSQSVALSYIHVAKRLGIRVRPGLRSRPEGTSRHMEDYITNASGNIPMTFVLYDAKPD